MAVFKNTIITDAGRKVLSDALANSKRIIFTKISTSNKEYQDTVDIAKIITLENVKQTTTLSNIKQEGTKITINAVFTNSSVETAYLINTIGLYAKVEEGVEILFSITRASIADTMPASNGINLSTVEIDLVTEINNADGATIEFNPSTLVTFSTLATSEAPGITKYGTEAGTALEGKRLAEILGAEFGGVIQDTGTKEQGKIYYDTATKYYYECLVNNDLTYNESTKFRAISNKPISDKLENLFSSGNNWVRFPNGLIMQWGNLIIPNGNDLVNFNVPFKSLNYQIVVSDSGGGVHIISSKPHSTTQFNAFGKQTPTGPYISSGLRWFAVGY